MSYRKDQFEYERLLGSLIAQKDPFFEKIACMADDWRQIAGMLEILKTLYPNDKELIKVVDTILYPVIQRLGQAEFRQDIVTHLAMKLRSIRKISDAK